MLMRLLCLVSLSLLISLPASAALIDNGNSMFDTDTNLVWLELTETIGLSVNEANATTFVTVEGYIHATDEQVAAMMLNAGFLTTNNVANVGNDPAAVTLLSLLGCTQFCGIADVNATGRGFADWNGLGTYTRAFYKEGPLGGAAATTSGLTADLDLQDATSGHFLVRVPEPGSALLLVLGISGLAIAGRPTRR